MSNFASYLIAAICVAKTYYCSSKIFVTFSWKAKYSSLFSFFMVLFIALTSSFTFFFDSYLAVSSPSISSRIYLGYDFLASLWFVDLFSLRLVFFFIDIDRSFFRSAFWGIGCGGSLSLRSSFLLYSFLLNFGGILFGAILAFIFCGALCWVFSSFFIFLFDSIFWIFSFIAVLKSSGSSFFLLF